jgi:hypothetical protein
MSEFVEKRPSPEDLFIQNEQSEILRKTAREMPARYQPYSVFTWTGWKRRRLPEG